MKKFVHYKVFICIFALLRTIFQPLNKLSPFIFSIHLLLMNSEMVYDTTKPSGPLRVHNANKAQTFPNFILLNNKINTNTFFLIMRFPENV